jgi:hypothetical protein
MTTLNENRRNNIAIKASSTAMNLTSASRTMRHFAALHVSQESQYFFRSAEIQDDRRDCDIDRADQLDSNVARQGHSRTAAGQHASKACESNGGDRR